jgi:hypothetical protein
MRMRKKKKLRKKQRRKKAKRKAVKTRLKSVLACSRSHSKRRQGS